MRIVFEKIDRAIDKCPTTQKRADKETCKNCDTGFEVRSQIHCTRNDPVGICVSSIGKSLDDTEIYAVELKPEFGMYGSSGKSFAWPVKNGVIGKPVYVSKSLGYYCRTPVIDANQDQRDQLTTRLSLRREK